MALAKRIWLFVAVALLPIGVVAAALDYLPSDAGLGVLWFLAVGLIAAPLGTVFFVAASIVLGLIERAALGPEMHFASVAQICLLWTAALTGGLLQAAVVRRWRASRSKEDDA